MDERELKEQETDLHLRLWESQEEINSLKQFLFEINSRLSVLTSDMETVLNARGIRSLLKMHAILGAVKRESFSKKMQLIRRIFLRTAGIKKPLDINKYRMDIQLKQYLRKIEKLLDDPRNVQLKDMEAVESKKNLQKLVKKILDSDYDRIVMWNSSFGWNVTLFQRPQHIASALAKQRTLVFYEVTEYTDPRVRTLREQCRNLWLVNRDSRAHKILLEELQNITKPKYMQIYSTEQELSVLDIRQYQKEGYYILYEYIDDINPDISVTKKIPINIQKKYEYVMNHPEIPVVVTAERLCKDVESKRGMAHVAYATNGVDYKHFTVRTGAGTKLKRRYLETLQKGKIIVGYYGALASWFDYKLVKETARRRKDLIFVLIGKLYDDSFQKAGLTKYENIIYLGEVPYGQLPVYAERFDICTIPFVVNELTNATSPLKLFEYMALAKPIITTGMHECKKYKSVLIADGCEEYCRKIDLAISYMKVKNEQYYGLLKKEALENTWDGKAESIINMLEHYEHSIGREEKDG